MYSNDFLSLQELVVRRFRLKEKQQDFSDYPDVFILDGGRTQLSILYELCNIFPVLRTIMEQKTTFIAL